MSRPDSLDEHARQLHRRDAYRVLRHRVLPELVAWLAIVLLAWGGLAWVVMGL